MSETSVPEHLRAAALETTRKVLSTTPERYKRERMYETVALLLPDDIAGLRRQFGDESDGPGDRDTRSTP